MNHTGPNQVKVPLPDHELVFYSDGFTGRRYQTPGDVITISTDTDHAPHRDFRIGVRNPLDHEPTGGDMTVITTELGRKIGLAAGLAIDIDRVEFEELPEYATYQVAIGDHNPDIPLLGGERVKELVAQTKSLNDEALGREPWIATKQKRAAQGPSDFDRIEQRVEYILKHHRDKLPTRGKIEKRWFDALR